MPSYTCEDCKEIFQDKYRFDKHKMRKTPCKKSPTVLALENRILQLQTNEPIDKPFRDLSEKLQTSMTLETRQAQGIFFTPKKARDLILEKFREYGVSPQTILEPSFGSGEFLEDFHKEYPSATLFGVEKNKDLYEAFIKDSKHLDSMNLDHMDFLKWVGPSVDIIVGNPPYFVIDTDAMDKAEKKEFSEKNKECMVGRPNIYVSFLYKCVKEHLNPNGYLAFVIPTSLMNCSYYQPMRDYIAKYMTICFMKELDVKYYQTGQDTMLLILQNKPGGKEYLYTMNHVIYMSPYWKELKEIFATSTSLGAMGFGSRTGEVVWNQEKEKMSETGTLVIYNTNIKDGKLVLGNITSKVGSKSEKKRQYIKGFKKAPMKGPVILINRGHGNATYHFNYVLIPESQGEFYAENHVNVIYPKSPEAAARIHLVLKSFENKKTEEFFRCFVGNGSFNSTEIENVLPIFQSSVSSSDSSST